MDKRFGIKCNTIRSRWGLLLCCANLSLSMKEATPKMHNVQEAKNRMILHRVHPTIAHFNCCSNGRRLALILLCRVDVAFAHMHTDTRAHLSQKSLVTRVLSIVILHFNMMPPWDVVGSRFFFPSSRFDCCLRVNVSTNDLHTSEHSIAKIKPIQPLSIRCAVHILCICTSNFCVAPTQTQTQTHTHASVLYQFRHLYSSWHINWKECFIKYV